MAPKLCLSAYVHSSNPWFTRYKHPYAQHRSYEQTTTNLSQYHKSSLDPHSCGSIMYKSSQILGFFAQIYPDQFSGDTDSQAVVGSSISCCCSWQPPTGPVRCFRSSTPGRWRLETREMGSKAAKMMEKLRFHMDLTTKNMEIHYVT